MKKQLFALAFTIAFCTCLQAADLNLMQKFPAIVGVLNMKPETLKLGEGKNAWARVPTELASRGAIIFMPERPVNGVADISVVEEGWVLVAVNYEYQGGLNEKLEDEIWSERVFKRKGWNLMTKKELGGDLVKTDGRVQVVFAKRLKKGDHERIRCNKYDPPYVIVLNKAGKPI